MDRVSSYASVHPFGLRVRRETHPMSATEELMDDPHVAADVPWSFLQWLNRSEVLLGLTSTLLSWHAVMGCNTSKKLENKNKSLHFGAL
jgi:hypothetical protein